jgi:hypothetical protein
LSVGVVWGDWEKEKRERRGGVLQREGGKIIYDVGYVVRAWALHATPP